MTALASPAFALATPAFAQTATPPAATTADTTAAKPVVALGNIRTFGGEVGASGNIRTFQGDIDPYGNIRTFAGDLQANGNIRTFNGAINPYIGNIRTFSGSVNPLVGNIRTFWGALTPSLGELNPMVGNIRTFAGTFDATTVDLLNSWNAAAKSGSYGETAGKLNTLVTQSQLAWGGAVTARTGKSFTAGFADPLFAKYGIDTTKTDSLGALDAVTRQLFLMDWYDGLMGYSGMDQVDHWMGQINWSPSITETIGEGKKSVIGLLDFSITGDGTKNVVKYDGISTFSNGHGSAVASLMIAAHDGKGVMGIAPMASVVAYNPFDASGTADWADIKNGVLMLGQNGASIINMSLGVPGWTLHSGWNGVFSDSTVSAAAKSAVFVVAAGNDGSTQKANVTWNFATNPNLIIVGSVDPTSTISSFSNRPGSACLVASDGAACGAGNRLMDRYVVAPGELILVSDGQGGTTRMSGTSFAAPLVSGTVALLHDRWPWLSKYPKESVDIILSTAKDLGAAGTDAVYGRGMLDVTAALSPLSFDGLKWYTYDAKGKIAESQEKKIRDPKEVAKWEAKGLTFFAYEDIGGTFRDFAIPASSKLADQSALSAGGTMERLQAYIYERFLAWVNSGAPTKTGPGGFTNFASADSPIPNAYGLNLSMSVAPRVRRVGFQQTNVPFQSALRLASPGDRFALTVGEGDGAVMLGDAAGFGFASDYDPYVGGANPLLGYASGGGYVQTKVRLGDSWTVSASATGRTLRRDFTYLPFEDRAAYAAIGSYRASAQTIGATYRANARFSVSGTYARLNEARAILGMQSTDRNDVSGGSTTDGFTLGSDLKLSSTLTLTGSGTVGLTRAGGAQNFTTGGRGLVTSAFQAGVAKDRVFDAKDQLRLTVAQPMHLEAGRIDVTMVQVVDRQQGTLGAVTQSFDLTSPKRQFIGEAMYGRSILGDTGRVSLFGRFNLRGDTTEAAPALMAGAGLNLSF